ncbi:MAG: hypothetical protein LBT39_01545 [Treponema sp.]|nr:hypothetical protein [Treponema sp.]
MLSNLIDSANKIDAGRKSLAVRGREPEGGILYKEGISGALTAFQEAGVTAEPQTIVLAEIVFLQQELQFCSKDDGNAQNSLTQAIQSFNDALRAFEVVLDAGYKIVEKTYPQNSKHRFHQMPKDAFHIACISHRTRIQNILRVPGMNMTEKTVYQQRFTNMTIAQESYFKLQEKQIGK